MSSVNESTPVLSSKPAQEVGVCPPGKSGFTPTLVNVIADLLGTGVLACPIAFAHAGWFLGTIILLLSAAITLYSLSIIILIIEQDSRLRNYTDVMGYAFGPNFRKIIAAFLAVEVTCWSISCVDLFGDSMTALVPQCTSNQWKVIGLAITLPTAFLPLRNLAWTSAVGVASTWLLLGLLIFCGVNKDSSPGSLRDPAHTDLLPSHGVVKLGTVVGLLVSGYGGHGLVPNLIRDMQRPQQALLVCKTAYGVTVVTYILIASLGYLMYGTNVTDEISRDLALTPGVLPWINKLAVLSVALTVIGKLPLAFVWPSDMIMTYFKLYPSYPSGLRPEDISSSSPSPTLSPVDLSEDTALRSHAEVAYAKRERVKSVLRTAVRVAVYVAATVGGILFPTFESLTAFLGSASVITLIVTVPIAAGGMVFGWDKKKAGFVALSIIMAAIGTLCSFWPAS